ncbi:MAG TPA: CcdB family protein [Halomonas sp.]|nr:CcdB family protein [Halomonas sp.]
MLPHQKKQPISSVPEKLLKRPVGSLSHFRDQVVAALDLAITGI